MVLAKYLLKYLMQFASSGLKVIHLSKLSSQDSHDNTARCASAYIN